jgi:prepilin-type N-terminal cleavage/methylation domain-containing protein
LRRSSQLDLASAGRVEADAGARANPPVDGSACARARPRRSLELLGRVVRRVGNEGAFTLAELIMAMAILGLVVGGITGILVSATKHEAALNLEFQAQESARLALTKMRSDVHCAATVSPSSGTASSITLALSSGCPTGMGSFTWCTAANGTRFDLWRIPSASCTTTTSGSVRWAQGLTAGSIFIPDATVHSGAPVLPEVAVDFAVAAGTRSYRLADKIYLRNGARQ